jgi:hypothetical protein
MCSCDAREGGVFPSISTSLAILLPSRVSVEVKSAARPSPTQLPLW